MARNGIETAEMQGARAERNFRLMFVAIASVMVGAVIRQQIDACGVETFQGFLEMLLGPMC